MVTFNIEYRFWTQIAQLPIYNYSISTVLFLTLSLEVSFKLESSSQYFHT